MAPSPIASSDYNPTNSNTDSNLSLIESLLLPHSRSANQTKSGQERAIYGCVARDSGRWYLQREGHSCKSHHKFGVQELGLGFWSSLPIHFSLLRIPTRLAFCFLIYTVLDHNFIAFPPLFMQRLHFTFFFPIFCFRILLSRTSTTSTTAVY
jgi:hypothetical protein